MIEICPNDKCTGCGKCVDICHMKAISMVLDEYGFLVPKINNNLCVNCSLCVKNCTNNIDLKLVKPIELVKCFSNNKTCRLNSSSGGIFSELAEHTIKEQGVVIGANMNDTFDVNHISINTMDDIYKLRKSKYIGSNLSGIYNKIKFLLEQQKNVMFVGTPCQVFALKTFLGKEYQNLLTIDFLCHGVSSHKVFKNYVSKIGLKYNSKCVNFDFRLKKGNYLCYNYAVYLENGKIINKISVDNEVGYFFGNKLTTRLSCDSCKFAQIDRCSDITLADYTEQKNEILSLNELKYGVSLVLINNNKGYDTINKICDKLTLKYFYDLEYLSKRTNHLSKINIEQKDEILNAIKNNDFKKIANIFKNNKNTVMKRICVSNPSISIVKKIIKAKIKGKD